MDTKTGLAARDRKHYPLPAEDGVKPAAATYLATISAAQPFVMVLVVMGEDGN